MVKLQSIPVKKLAQSLLLATALVSGSSSFAMEQEDTSTTIQKSMTKQEIENKLPILTTKIPEAFNYIIRTDSRKTGHIVQYLKPFQAKFETDNDLIAFIRIVKDLTPKEWEKIGLTSSLMISELKGDDFINYVKIKTSPIYN